MALYYNDVDFSLSARIVKNEHSNGPVHVHGMDPEDGYDNVRNEGDPIVEFLLQGGYLAVPVAPMQFGKTAIMQYIAYNLVLSYLYHRDNIFFVTGLGNVQWLEQTKERLIPSFRDHVYHNAGTRKAAEEVINKVRLGGNTLIAIDEAHFGAGVNNTWPKFLAEIAEGIEGAPVCMTRVHHVLHSHRVSLLLVSATPDAVKENMVYLPESLPTKTFTVNFTKYPRYVSCKTYLESGNVRETHRIEDMVQPLNKNAPVKAFWEILRGQIHKMQPKYHLIRLHEDDDEGLLRKKLQDDDDPDFIEFRYLNAAAKDFDPEEFEVAPQRHVVVFLKDMLRVAKSISIEHVGVIVERPVKNYNDSTVCQSLMGRCCGWDKWEHYKKIVIYTHIDSVKRYVDLVENDFDYSKVANITGYKMKTTATKMTTGATATGPGVKKAMNLPTLEEKDKKTENEAGHRLLGNALTNTYGRAFQVFKLLLENHNMPLRKKDFIAAMNGCDAKSFTIENFTKWNLKHHRYEMLEKVGPEGYRLRADVLERYKDQVKALVV